MEVQIRESEICKIFLLFMVRSKMLSTDKQISILDLPLPQEIFFFKKNHLKYYMK